ncbi:hypothetical protein ACFXJ5_03585 [Streptomyces sp. NPDC059373]
MAVWDARQQEPGEAQPGTLTLMYSHATGSSPAWQRLIELLSPLPHG